LRCGIEIFVGGEPGGEVYRFAQPVQHVELVALDPRNLQPEAVRTEVYGGEDGLMLHKGRGVGSRFSTCYLGATRRSTHHFPISCYC